MAQMDRTQRKCSISSVKWQGESHFWLYCKFDLTMSKQTSIFGAFFLPACSCGITPTSPVWWRTQERRRSGPACHFCVWKGCLRSSRPASSAFHSGWLSSCPTRVGSTHISFCDCANFLTDELLWNSQYPETFVSHADAPETSNENDDTDINYFYIRQFQVHPNELLLVFVCLF